MAKNPPKDFKPEPFAYHQEVILTISALTNLGVGVGRLERWVVMVPFTLPGERVRVRVWRNHKNFSDADLVEIIEPSPQRIEPQCKLFGVCRGCQYQHFDYSGQLAWKTRQVRELLERLAGSAVPVNPTQPSPKVYGYRTKLTPHFQKPRKGELSPIGFQRHDSPRIVDVAQCPIATEAINAVLPKARRKVHHHPHKYDRGGTLLLRDTLEGVITNPKAIVSQKVGHFLFQFQAGEFFQNNPFLVSSLVDHVVQEAQGQGIRYLIDTYCGVGMFCLSASPYFERLMGVETSALSIHWAKVNAIINSINNSTFRVGTAETIFGAVDFPPRATAIIIDPPRQGCKAPFLEQLLSFGPKRIVYVSCDPATQARDLKAFLKDSYQITCVQPFDLFPQTRHIESVVTLDRVHENWGRDRQTVTSDTFCSGQESL